MVRRRKRVKLARLIALLLTAFALFAEQPSTKTKPKSDSKVAAKVPTADLIDILRTEWLLPSIYSLTTRYGPSGGQ
jgi:hypothetical protein